MNWYQEGKEQALEHLDDINENGADAGAEPECPWPIHTPEGALWFKGWNSVANEQDPEGYNITTRPYLHPGFTFA